MDGLLPNFKVGEAASKNHIFQKDDVILDDTDSSIVVLAKNVIGSVQDSMSNDKKVPQLESDDQLLISSDPSIVVLAKNVIGSVQDSMSNDKKVPQLESDDQLLISSNLSDRIRVKQKLHQVLDENNKLKQTLEESETIMKQQFEKIEAWQKEVITLYQNHNKKLVQSKVIIEHLKTENELLSNFQGLLQNQSTKSVSMSGGVAAESSSLNTSAYSSASIEKEPSLAQNNSLTKTIKTFNSRTRDSSLDNNMTVVSLKIDNMSQLQDVEMQCVSPESGSVTASVDTQTPAAEAQRAISTAAEIRSMNIHSNSSQSKNLSITDIENKLQKIVEESKALVKQSEKLTIRFIKDGMSLRNDQSKKSTETEKRKNQLIANNFSSGIASENDASHAEKRNLTQEGERLQKLKILSANNFSLRDMIQNTLHCLTANLNAEDDIKSIKAFMINGLRQMSHMIFEARKRIMETNKTTQTSKTQCISPETESVNSSVETQTPATECASIETEARLSDIVIDTGSKTQTLGTVTQLTLAILECYKQIKGLEENAKQILKSRNFTKYVDSYTKTLMKLNNYFSSMQSPCTEHQKIVLLAIQQFHKLQLDLSFLINELAITMMEKEEVKTCDTVLVEKEKEKLYVAAIQNQIKNMTAEDKINLIKEKASVQNQSQMITINQDKRLQNMTKESNAVEKSILEKEVLLLQEKYTELTKKLDEINDLYILKEDLSQERESLEELRKLLDDKMKSHQEEHEVLTKENTLLKNKCDMLVVGVNNFNTELIESHKTITNLRKQIDELREAANTVEVYKVQNNAQAKDILHMFEAEQNYLEEIERLSNKIEKLQEENARLKNNSQQV